MISKGNHVNFARLVLLAVSEDAETWLPSFCVQCIIKQLLDSVFVISRIIKVSVRVISLSLRLRLITRTSTLIILDITKTSSNNCLQLCACKCTSVNYRIESQEAIHCSFVITHYNTHTYILISEGHSSQAPSHLPDCYAGHKETFFQISANLLIFTDDNPVVQSMTKQMLGFSKNLLLPTNWLFSRDFHPRIFASPFLYLKLYISNKSSIFVLKMWCTFDLYLLICPLNNCTQGFQFFQMMGVDLTCKLASKPISFAVLKTVTPGFVWPWYIQKSWCLRSPLWLIRFPNRHHNNHHHSCQTNSKCHSSSRWKVIWWWLSLSS